MKELEVHIVSMDDDKVEYNQKIKIKILKNIKIREGTKNMRNPHILCTLAIFLVFLRSDFFFPLF